MFTLAFSKNGFNPITPEINYDLYDPTLVTSFIVIDSLEVYSGKYISTGDLFSELDQGSYIGLFGGMFLKEDNQDISITITGGNHLLIQDYQNYNTLSFSGPNEKITKDNFWNNEFSCEDLPKRTIKIIPNI